MDYKAPRILTGIRAWRMSDDISAGIYECKDIWIDMSDVEIIDYEGFRALIHCSQAATRNGVDLLVSNPSKEARALLELTRLDYLLPIAGEDKKNVPQVSQTKQHWIVTAAAALWSATFGYLIAKGID